MHFPQINPINPKVRYVGIRELDELLSTFMKQSVIVNFMSAFFQHRPPRKIWVQTLIERGGIRCTLTVMGGKF